MSEYAADYDVAAAAWDAGPGRLYRAMAAALLDTDAVGEARRTNPSLANRRLI